MGLHGVCMARPYEDLSFWLEDTGEPLTPRSSLQRSCDVDVAILGAGYTGLWTAYYLLRNDPGLRVAIVEREIAGYGASGRNGGWCSPRFPLSASELTRRYGAGAARAVILALQSAVNEIREACDRESIDACFRACGTLTVARGAHQVPALKAALAGYERLGLADRYQYLRPEEVAERVRVTDVHAGLYTSDGASLHPARLVRGLARAVEAHGGVIYEQADVTEFHGGRLPRLVTAAGEVRAAKAIVLAGEAYMTRLRMLHRALLPVYSLICLTEPLTPEQWQEIGWKRGENLSSTRNTVVYLTKTPGGRILFGSRGAPYAYGSKISDAQDRHAKTIELIQRSLREWFPSLAGIRFTHAWGGPVGMPMDWTPAVRFDPKTRIGFAGGYTGQGVAASNLAGQMLAAMIAGRDSGFRALPFAQRRSPNWIPEPLRWLVMRYMQGAFQRIDEAAEAGKPRPADAAIAERIGRH
jgi:glycine/D-amino acid oxidase-like deaminating enzyme